MSRFIDKHPGTILETTGFSTQEELNNFIETHCSERLFIYDNTSESYKKILQEYVFNGTRLDEIPQKCHISTITTSALASDICGTIIGEKERVYGKPTKVEEPRPKKSGFDIYEYAEQMPYADYMDMHTGLIYHIPEYIAAKNSGDVSARIRVTDNGVTIGYAEKL